MKIISIITVTLFITTSAWAQKSDSTAVYSVLEEIFTVCNSASAEGENSNLIIFERLAQYIAYNGNDVARKFKINCDYNKSEDRKIVDDAGFTIKSLLDKIEKYSLKKYNYVKEGSLDKYTLLINCKSGTSNKEINFVFVKVKNSFLLAEIKQ
ncbi:MAG: hypothetical protein U0W24_14660 [Bacteroidales bacterium]